MTRRSPAGRRAILAGTVASAAMRPGFAQDSAGVRSPESIEPLLAAQVDARATLGYVAGIVGEDQSRIVAAGQSGAPGARALDGRTVFEIGSVTKLFTAVLLADMARRGEVALTDPVARYLPPEGRPPAVEGQPITLLDLVTHTSGLPRLPSNLHPTSMANPYADYTVGQLYQALAGNPSLAAPGSSFIYSNFGFGLLGHVLALRAGCSFEELVVSRICAPLGMDDTRITLTPSMRERLAPGHDATLAPVPAWDLPALPGAGALRSTAQDLLAFLLASEGRRDSPLAPAMASLLDVRRPADARFGLAAAFGWLVQTARGDELVWMDGGTGGYASFIGYSTRSSRGVVLLSNTANNQACVMLGLHLLNTAYPLPARHPP